MNEPKREISVPPRPIQYQDAFQHSAHLGVWVPGVVRCCEGATWTGEVLNFTCLEALKVSLSMFITSCHTPTQFQDNQFHSVVWKPAVLPVETYRISKGLKVAEGC